MSDAPNTQLPQNIAIHVGNGGGSDRPFFDRHFGAVLAAIGVVSAAAVTAIYKANEAETEPVANFEIATSDPIVGNPVKFLVSEARGYTYTMRVAAIDAAPSSKGASAVRSDDGVFYSWTPEVPGEYVAELSILVNDKRGYEVTRKFAVRSNTTSGSSSVSPADSTPISQLFTYRVGDNATCTEKNAVRRFDVCLPENIAVTDWDGRYQSVRNGSADVTRNSSLANCVVLTLQYSDSGRGPFGDCKGNGWVDYALTLNGRQK